MFRFSQIGDVSKCCTRYANKTCVLRSKFTLHFQVARLRHHVCSDVHYLHLFLRLTDPIRQDSSSDHEYDVPPPTLPEKKKRANTITSDSSTPAKIAPPPPIEKSRRGDSLGKYVCVWVSIDCVWVSIDCMWVFVDCE